MTNLDFTKGWKDITIGWPQEAQRSAQQPEEWELSVLGVGEQLKSARAFDDIDEAPVFETAYTIPECVHKLRKQLPDADDIILQGDIVYKIFSAYMPFSATLKTEIPVKRGNTYRITVPILTHQHGDGSPGAAAWRVVLDNDASEWHTFKRDFRDREHSFYIENIKAQGDTIELQIDVESRAIGGIDFFINPIACDLVEIAPRIEYAVIYNVVPQDASIDRYMTIANTAWKAGKQTVGGSHDDAGRLGGTAILWDIPEEQQQEYLDWYKKYYPNTVVVFKGETRPEFPTPPPADEKLAFTYPTTHMPPVITSPYGPRGNIFHYGIDLRSSWKVWKDELLAAVDGEIILAGVESGKEHFGHQVQIRTEINGDMVVVRYAHLVPKAQGGIYVSVGHRVKRGDKLGRPDNTGTSTADHLHFDVRVNGHYIDPTEKILWPSQNAPKPPQEPQYSLRSNWLIGLHSGRPGKKSRKYIEQSGTTCQKFFSAGNAWEAKQYAPEIVSVWRKYVGNEEGRIFEKPTIRESAIWYLDQYTAEIEAAAKNFGLTVPQFLGNRIYIESLNETIPTYNPAGLQNAVEFDVCFAEETYKRYGDMVQTVLLNGAIGNPHESEVSYLLPAAKAVVKYGGFLGYHAYWTANEHRSFLVEHWDHHAGRWQKWDEVFRSKGIFPRYLSTEGGIVYAHDGISFNSGKGWKSCGSIEPYLKDMEEFNRRAWEWNQGHGNRFAGLTIFCYNNGWEDFELGDGDVELMIKHGQEWRPT